MTNAKTEFLATIEKLPRLKCAVIRDYDASWRDEHGKEIFLKEGFSENDFEGFLDAIDFHYHSGFGGQELFGFIWFEDGTWAERGEYDGSEWWEYKSQPEIPNGCK